MSNSKDTDSKTITFRSSGLSGDLISFMAGVKAMCESNQSKAVIYMWMDRKCRLYEGAQHPYGDVMFNQYAFDMMKPLIEAQSYVESFQIWTGEAFLVDLDIHREYNIGLPFGSIHKWMGLMYPEMLADLSEAWLETGTKKMSDMERFEGKILINRTSRYNNHTVNYFFLKDHQDKLMFLGTPAEHKAFNEEWNLNIPHLIVKDFLDLATQLSACRFFIGNQSMCYAIAEGMKIPRLMEYCTFAPNVIAVGKNAYEYAWQSALEILFNKLDKEL